MLIAICLFGSKIYVSLAGSEPFLSSYILLTNVCHITERKEDKSMLKKVHAFPLVMYLAFTGFVRNIKEDERGLSGVVVAILLILVAVLAIVLIWGFLSGWLKELWDSITGKAAQVQ